MPETVKCKEPGCGVDFVVEDGEINFLKEKFGADFKLPQRCKPCRAKKKERMAARDGNGNGPSSGRPAPQPSQGGDDYGDRRPRGKKGKKRRRDEYSDY